MTGTSSAGSARWSTGSISRFPELGRPDLEGVQTVYDFDDRYTAATQWISLGRRLLRALQSRRMRWRGSRFPG